MGENGHVLTCRCDSFVMSASPLHFSEDYWQSPDLCLFNTYPVEIFIPVTLMARQCPVNRPFAARYSWVQNPHAREQEMSCEKTNKKNTILNSLVKCNLTKLTTTSLAVKWSMSLVVKQFMSLAVKQLTSFAVKQFTCLVGIQHSFP